MGRVNQLAECLPSGCGTSAYDKVLAYSYDWLGNILTSTDGAGVMDTYTYSPANEVTSITSSINDSSHPPNLVSNVQNGPFGPLTWQLGNGLTGVSNYDQLGRTIRGWLCQGSSQAYCAGGNQLYGFTISWTGDKLAGACDTVLNVCQSYGYDEFNRLASRTVTAGTPQNFQYVYDRWGNRAQQNVTAGSGPAPQFSINTANNQITNSGFVYDAAGNMTSDGLNTYAYDAEGNQTQAGAETFAYNALNQRVEVAYSSGGGTLYAFNLAGQRASIWDLNQGYLIQGQSYWGNAPVEYYSGGYAQFQHQDWLGTERMRTRYDGNVDGTFFSLPFGDGYAASGNDYDAYHFAGLDQDTSSNEHAQFREYSNMQGRWTSPDPYAGSYDFTNPQSFNRYSYVMNNPLSFVDPLGLELVYNPGDGCWDVWDPNTNTLTGTLCSTGGGGGGSPNSGGGGGGGGARGAPGAPAPKNDVINKLCKAIPSGRVIGGVGALGAVVGAPIGAEEVLNYNSGQISGFAYTGAQMGWNGVASGSLYSGYAYGLNNSNSNYKDGFTGFAGSLGVFGGMFSSSSKGLTGGASGLVFHPSTPGNVTTAAISFGLSWIGGFTVAFPSATNYSDPVQMGSYWGFDIQDWGIYAARQLCKAASH